MTEREGRIVEIELKVLGIGRSLMATGVPTLRRLRDARQEVARLRAEQDELIKEEWHEPRD